MDKICCLLIGVTVGVCVYKNVCDKKQAKQDCIREKERKRRCEKCVLIPYQYCKK